MQEEFADSLLGLVDSSFKYILIVFNLITLLVVYVHKQRQRHKKEHHVLFVTAHPDDEAMFFRPSLRSITKDYFVHLLCLTGKGTDREQQLIKSAQWLNIHKLECVSNQHLNDSISIQWPHAVIQQIVTKYTKQNTIKAIFTFDSDGVSKHPNHKSISQALQSMQYQNKDLKLLNKKPTSLTPSQQQMISEIKQNSIKIYHLNSVNILRKYTGPFEILFALVKDFSWVNLNLIDAYRLMAVHKSQFVWYRKLWVVFSQYSYVNTFSLSRINVNIKAFETADKNSIGKTPIINVHSSQRNQQTFNNQSKKQK